MANENNNMHLLVEGYDPNKVFQDEGYDRDWRKIVSARQNGTIMQAEIGGFENIQGKECAVINVGKIRGYIPIDLSGFATLRQLRSMSGQKVVFKVLEYIEEADKKIFMASRISALDEMANITLRKIKVGDEIIAVVRSVTPAYLRADIGGIEVRISATEVRHGWIDDLTDHAKVGDHLNVKVMEIDKESKKVVVSAKALVENPWESCKTRYKVNSEYVGIVSGVRDFGIFVALEDGVDSLASHLKFQNVSKGDKVLVRISSIDNKNEQVRIRIVRVI